MNNKKKYLSVMTDFTTLDSTFLTHNFLFEKLSKKFEKIFIINSENLKFFPKIARRLYRRHQGWKESFREINKLPENFVLFDPLEPPTILLIDLVAVLRL